MLLYLPVATCVADISRRPTGAVRVRVMSGEDETMHLNERLLRPTTADVTTAHTAAAADARL